MPRALFLIENVPFRLDTRVRRQTCTLQGANIGTIVICPREPREPWHDVVGGVHVYRYWKPGMGEGFGTHLLEYLFSLIAQTALTAFVFLRHGFDVIHVANPPDILWLVAAPYKLFGKRFIYDQHDLVPELFEVRFGNRLRVLSRWIFAMEHASYQLADHVVTTTESFRRIAIQRGGRRPEDVTVVRNGPFLSRDFPRVEPDPRIRALGKTVVGYLGIMNAQDNLENFLEMARVIRADRGRTDIAFVMVGSGDAFDRLKMLRDQMGLVDAVLMTGSLPWRDVLGTLMAADICVQPDAPNCFNQHLAMNKLMEYMALGKPAVAFDMEETRVTGGDAVLYVSGDSPAGLAEAVLGLADDPMRQQLLGQAGRRRVETELAWEHQAVHLLGVYRRLFSQELSARAQGVVEGTD
jgi:glycosyltransferase involved in cell wall biosynthesis